MEMVGQKVAAEPRGRSRGLVRGKTHNASLQGTIGDLSLMRNCPVAGWDGGLFSGAKI